MLCVFALRCTQIEENFSPKNWFTLENAQIIFEKIFRDIYP